MSDLSFPSFAVKTPIMLSAVTEQVSIRNVSACLFVKFQSLKQRQATVVSHESTEVYLW